MATSKHDVVRMIESMPEDASLEDIMAELYFRAKVDEGLRQLDQASGLEHDDVRGRLGRWLAD